MKEESHTIGLRDEEFVVLEKHRKIFSVTAFVAGLIVGIVFLSAFFRALFDSSTIDLTSASIVLIGIALMVVGLKETSFTWKESKNLNDEYKVVKRKR
jgi:hypothetical protein